jgi:hypothetical protein
MFNKSINPYNNLNINIKNMKKLNTIDPNGKELSLSEENEYMWNITLDNYGILDRYNFEDEEILYHKIEEKM